MQFYEADVLAVPRGTPKKEMALDYLRYATGSEPLAGMARFAPFTPPRRSALPLVEKLPPSPTRDFVLSQKGMLDRSFAIDNGWWRAHGPVLEARFRIWAASVGRHSHPLCDRHHHLLHDAPRAGRAVRWRAPPAARGRSQRHGRLQSG
jgi:hypothetical protein